MKEKLLKFWQRWQNFIKIGISLSLFVYLFRQIPIAEVWVQLQHLRLSFGLLSLLVLIGSLTLFAYAWLIILKALRFSTSFRETWELFFESAFINNFVTFWGGDIVRTVRLGRSTQRGVDATVSVLVSRLAMFYTVLGMAGVSLWLWGEAVGWPRSFTTFGMILTIILLLGGILFFLFCTFFPRDFSESEGMVGRVMFALLTIGRHAKVLLGVGFNSLLAQLGTVWAVWWLAAGLEMQVTWWQLLLFLSVIGIALILPVSFNGLGVRELGLVSLLEQVGVDPSLALALSLTTSVVVILASFPGGLLLLRDAFGKSNEE